MRTHGVGALLLLGTGNVKYAAGARGMPADSARTIHERTAVLLLPDSAPHLFTPWPEGAPAELAAENVHPPLWLESEAGVCDAARRLRDAAGGAFAGPVGIDEHSSASFFGLGRALEVELTDAAPVLAAPKLCKTPDEIECIRLAQQINERAMLGVRELARPGVQQTDLSARFFAELFALGATGNGIDPIWQVMPRSRAEGPYTTNGDVAFPTCTTDRILRDADVLWVDAGIDYEGYASDVRRTWIVGTPGLPDSRQREQFQRWCAVIEAVLEGVRPGATGRDLTQRAIEADAGRKPWLDHFYLIHGVGTEPAEMPLIGTDLGEAFDERLVLAPGMVLDLEPVIWDDGHAGYRSEEIVAVTEHGYAWLSDHPYAPFEGGVAR